MTIVYIVQLILEKGSNKQTWANSAVAFYNRKKKPHLSKSFRPTKKCN